MAKSFDDPLDVLKALDEAGAPTAAKTPTRKKSSKRGTAFDDPLAAVSPQAIARATDSKGMAGRYQRKTMLLLPQQLEYLQQIAHKEGMGLMETHRWLLDVAFRAYDQGLHPEVEEQTVRVRARMGHWSGREPSS